jgi:hypothetical protein
MSGSAVAGIVFLGAAATAGALVALSWAQTRLDATTTAVILTLEPLVGAGLGAEAWTATTLAGGIVVLTSVCLVARPGGRTATLRRRTGIAMVERICGTALGRVHTGSSRAHPRPELAVSIASSPSTLPSVART